MKRDGARGRFIVIVICEWVYFTYHDELFADAVRGINGRSGARSVLRVGKARGRFCAKPGDVDFAASYWAPIAHHGTTQSKDPPLSVSEAILSR